MRVLVRVLCVCVSFNLGLKENESGRVRSGAKKKMTKPTRNAHCATYGSLSLSLSLPLSLSPCLSLSVSLSFSKSLSLSLTLSLSFSLFLNLSLSDEAASLGCAVSLRAWLMFSEAIV